MATWRTRLENAILDAVAPSRCAGCDAAGSVLCEECVADVVSQPVPIVPGVQAAFAYDGRVRRVLHRGKFRDCRAALRALAFLGAERVTAPPGAAVVAMPLGARRERARGYNQALVVARAFADVHRVRVVDALQRSRETAAQSALGGARRRQNPADAFLALPAARGARLWLVDDVVTTGSTLRAAAAALSGVGAEVQLCALAAVV